MNCVMMRFRHLDIKINLGDFLVSLLSDGT